MMNFHWPIANCKNRRSQISHKQTVCGVMKKL